MDHLNSPVYRATQQPPHNQATSEGRQSLDSQRIHLRKKRSYNNAGVRNASQPLPAPAWPQNTNIGETGDNERARKGTLRNVVRRIFGRRSKEFDPHPPIHASPPRHGHHRSEPPALSLPKPATHHVSEQDSTIPHRTLSAPVHHLIPPPPLPPNLDRQRSPYAVEFPHSARLKPLNLANPFTAPGSQLRRRKTLPSLVVPDNNEGPSQTPDDAQGSPERNRPSLRGSGQDTVSPRRRGSGPHHGTTPRNSKRKSRSVGDLKLFQRTTAAAAAPEQPSSPRNRKRNEDLRIWRDSLHGYNDDYVLRASGFTSAMFAPPPRSEGEGEGRGSGEAHGDERVQTPTAGKETSSQTRVLSGRAETTTGNGDTDFLQHQPIPRTGELAREEGTKTEEEEEEEEGISHDLEDRVAKLEAGLRHFQHSLQRITTTTDDRSRSSGPVGSRQARTPPSSRRGGVRGVDYARTPSMLADTLAADFISPPRLHHQHHPQGFDGYNADYDPPLRRLPSSSPLQYYYRQPSSAVHEPQRPESPQTPPALQDSGLSPLHYGNLPGARPSMPPFPHRRASATMNSEEGRVDDDDREAEEDEEENFPFPAQAASFSLSRRRGRTGDLPSSSEMATPGLPVDSPSEPPPPPPNSGGGPWTRKESGGFHFPFSSSTFREDRQEKEEEEEKKEKERQLRQEHGQDRDRESEHRPPEYPASQQQQQQQQQHTFKSLYEMLSDERSARRNLEVQLKGLRREIRDLHLQVSSSSSVDVSADASPPDSRRRMLGDILMAKGGRGDGAALSGGVQNSFASQQQRRRHRPAFSSDGPGSGREGDGPQLQGTGDSGRTALFPQPSSQHAVGSHGDGVISRFSGSESEAGGGGGAETTTGTTMMGRYEEQRGEETDDEDELMTPLEAYQTPREEASRVGLREGIGAV